MADLNIEPKVGMGATLAIGSDCYPFTICTVGKYGTKYIEVQRDNYKRTDKNGLSEMQTYEYTPDPIAEKYRYTLRKNGRYVRKGLPMKYGGIYIGSRRAYFDPSF